MRRIVPLLLIGLALVVTAPGFGNHFVQDELPLIYRNDVVHRLDAPGRFVTTPYWHDPFPAALYRPLSTAALAVQWRLGGGRPAVYRWVSAALLAGASLALFELALLLLPLVPAAIAALLFVVHPVHVEATALGINQSELAVGLLLCWATAWYLRLRRRGDPAPGELAGIALLYAAAILFKEHAVVLPALLVAAELLLVPDPRPPARRISALRPFYLGLTLVAVLCMAARTAVLGGQLSGTFTAEALVGAGLAGRALTMLAVVGRWVLLLFWPSELQADYGPAEIAPATGFGGAQAIGLVIVLAWLAIVVVARRRMPVLAFGLWWIAIALFPVSNVLLPTGVVLAERTLFLASAGAAMAAAALVAVLRESRGGALTRATIAAGLLVVAGLALDRSRDRARVWRSEETLLRQTVIDAPRSFAAHLALARFLEDSGSAGAAGEAYRKAVTIRPTLVAQDRLLADQYRRAGLCRPAVRLYRRVLTIVPDDSVARASLGACVDSATPVPVR